MRFVNLVRSLTLLLLLISFTPGDLSVFGESDTSTMPLTTEMGLQKEGVDSDSTITTTSKHGKTETRLKDNSTGASNDFSNKDTQNQPFAAALANTVPSSPNSLNSSLIPGSTWTGTMETFSTLMQAFRSQINETLSDATTNALNAVGPNSIAISSFLQPEVGFLAYNIFIIDDKNQIHRVTVDARSGKVLSEVTVPTGKHLSVALPNGGLTFGSPPYGGGFILPAPPPPHGGGFILPDLPQLPPISSSNTNP